MLKFNTFHTRATLDSNTRIRIYNAIQSRDPQKLIQLIDENIDINGDLGAENSILHLAVSNDRIDHVRALLAFDAKINMQNEKGETPLHFAAAHNHSEIANELLEKGVDIDLLDNNGDSAYSIAIQKGHYDFAESLKLYNEFNSEPEKQLTPKFNEGNKKKSVFNRCIVSVRRGRLETILILFAKV